MKKFILKSLKIIGIVFLLLVLGITAFVNFAPAFGDAPSGESLEKIHASRNYTNDKFQNLVETKLDTRDPESSESRLKLIWKLLSPDEDKNPNEPLPSAKFSAANLGKNTFAWLGHSTVLMHVGDLFILTDPVFHQASPIPGTVEPFEITNPITIDDLPAHLDIVLISHDHYDHLDYKAIQKLDERVDLFLVPLGLKAHLLHWGVAAEKIQEKDWYEEVVYKNTRFIMTPARHFSGRGLTNQFSTLWCSWVVKSPEKSIFFNGDSGYFDEFKKIGKLFGPFDIAFIENGAYDKDWAEIHMMPEESVLANIDLQSKLMFPIHWGKFDLANHKWDEPIIRTYKETQLKNVHIATPLIGEVFDLENVPQRRWWELVRGD